MACRNSWKLLGGVLVVAGMTAGARFVWSQPAAEPPAERKLGESWSAERDAVERGVRAKLQAKVSVAFDKTPLEEAVADLGQRAGVAVWIDSGELADEGIALDTPVAASFGRRVRRPRPRERRGVDGGVDRCA
ncbi:MAG: hypothetical protein WD069_12140 [Planctomycetales bacterium]